MSPEILICYCYFLTTLDKSLYERLWKIVEQQPTTAFLKFVDIRDKCRIEK